LPFLNDFLKKVMPKTGSTGTGIRMKRRFGEKKPMEATASEADKNDNPFVAKLLPYGDSAYRLTVQLLGSSQGAEDAVQEAYLAALEKSRAGTLPDNPRAWFLKVVANTAKKQMRAEIVRRRNKPIVRGVADATEAADQAEQLSVVRRAFANLDEKYRLPLVLCYEEGLTQREAAVILNLPERTVSKYINEGLALLRRKLRAGGCVVSAALVFEALRRSDIFVPVGLSATLEQMLRAQAAGTVAATGAGAATATAQAGWLTISKAVFCSGILAAGGASLWLLSPNKPATEKDEPSAAGDVPIRVTAAKENNRTAVLTYRLGDSATDKEYAKLREEVSVRLKLRDYRGAEEKCRTMVSLPSAATADGEARFFLGCCLAAQGKKDDAFHELIAAANAGFHRADWLEETDELTGLRDDRHWVGLLAAVKKNKPQAGVIVRKKRATEPSSK
jgi:RNA polymerase sigma factor (sigma-70 family)